MGIDDKYPFNLYTSPFDSSSFLKTEKKMKKLREKEIVKDKVNKQLAPKMIKRLAKITSDPNRKTNPNILWNVKRQNHKLLETERNTEMRKRLENEILEADRQLIKNIDEETNWITEQTNKLTSKLNKGKPNEKPKPIK